LESRVLIPAVKDVVQAGDAHVDAPVRHILRNVAGTQVDEFDMVVLIAAEQRPAMRVAQSRPT
jgi:hypothetical protein